MLPEAFSHVEVDVFELDVELYWERRVDKRNFVGLGFWNEIREEFPE